MNDDNSGQNYSSDSYTNFDHVLETVREGAKRSWWDGYRHGRYAGFVYGFVIAAGVFVAISAVMQ